MSAATDWTKWHIGQRVWCKIQSDETVGYGDEVTPVVGNIYTIRDIRPFRDRIGLVLEEIRNRPRLYRVAVIGPMQEIEAHFDTRSFEPVREQNIDVFRQMCRAKTSPASKSTQGAATA